MSTKKRYVFRCGRWLAKDEDDGSIVREMPAEGDDIKKPQPGTMHSLTVLRFGNHKLKNYWGRRRCLLYWPDVADGVKLCMTVYKCLHSHAPDYLSELCTPVAQVAE